MPTSPLLGANVLVTGAGRGMGELYARKAAAKGASAIALWDIDREAVTNLASELSASGVTALPVTVDISRLDDIERALAETTTALGPVDILINNAGIVRGKRFWEHDPSADIEATLRINTLAPMWLTRAVLPSMLADNPRPKRILNIASAAGTLSNPNMSVYASSKWAMLGWSDSLRLELERDGHSHIAVTTFCPSYVSTGMFAGARGPLLTPIMTPEQAVDAAWRGMVAGKPLVTKPWTVRLAMLMKGLLPLRAWDWVAGAVFKVYSSMDEFTGRKEK